MKRNLAVLAVAAVVLWVGCESREAADILEPAFGKVDAACMTQYISDGTATRQELYDAIIGDIEHLFTDRNAQKAAKGHVDNIVYWACKGDYDAAADHLNSLVQQIEGSLSDDVLGANADLAAELVNYAILLATNPDDMPIAIPSGAFANSGILVVVDPNAGGTTVTTGNDKAAVDIGDFNSTTPFLLAIAAAGEGYEIVSNGEVPANGILIQMCGDELKALGHLKDGGGTELLEPVDLGAAQVVDCGIQSPPAQSGSLSRLPNWMRTVGRLAGSAVRKVFGPAPLYADYFAEKGLGGLANSFSPFYPVVVLTPLDPPTATISVGTTADLTTSLFGTADASLTVEWTSDNNAVAMMDGIVTGPAAGRTVSTGTVKAVGVGTATITAKFTGHYSTGTEYTFESSATITVPGVTVQLENLTPHDLRVTDGNAFSCILEAGKGATMTCKQGYEVGSTVTLTATAWSTGSSQLPLTSGHHIKILGLGCDKLWPDNQEPTAFCTFVMPSGMPTISFTLTN